MNIILNLAIKRQFNVMDSGIDFINDFKKGAIIIIIIAFVLGLCVYFIK